jgi:DNA-binding MarR family transcriptional regulator
LVLPAEVGMSFYTTPRGPSSPANLCARCRAEFVAQRSPLTERQADLLGFIREHITQHGYAPSFEEIALAFGYRSLATVHEHLSNLERKGYLTRRYNESRSIALVEASS